MRSKNRHRLGGARLEAVENMSKSDTIELESSPAILRGFGRCTGVVISTEGFSPLLSPIGTMYQLAQHLLPQGSSACVIGSWSPVRLQQRSGRIDCIRRDTDDQMVVIHDATFYGSFVVQCGPERPHTLDESEVAPGWDAIPLARLPRGDRVTDTFSVDVLGPYESEPVDWDRWHDLLDIRDGRGFSSSEQVEFEALRARVTELDAEERTRGKEAVASLVSDHERVIESIKELTEAIRDTPRQRKED